MPERKEPPAAPQAFRRDENVDRWPGSAQLDSGHLAASNRSWRTQWPQIDLGPCNKCNLCILYCPDAAIESGADGFPRVADDWCKGCGICAVECPKRCVHLIPESSRSAP